VFASGFSNGAAFCYRLAAERPAVVAAIAPVAGCLPRLSASQAEPLPPLHVHGTSDPPVEPPPVAGGEGSPVTIGARRHGAPRGPSAPFADRAESWPC
jgi:poly(3-hydroxybutyrate) depolymerase